MFRILEEKGQIKEEIDNNDVFLPSICNPSVGDEYFTELNNRNWKNDDEDPLNIAWFCGILMHSNNDWKFIWLYY
jgi:hypothetical protein